MSVIWSGGAGLGRERREGEEMAGGRRFGGEGCGEEGEGFILLVVALVEGVFWG